MRDLWAPHLAAVSIETVTLRTREVLADGENTHVGVQVIAPAPGVRPRAVWTVPADAVSTTRKWSATSIESLITCPLKYTLTYAAKLRPGRSESLPGLRMMAGTFGHALFEEVMFEPTPGWDAITPEYAHDRLFQRFEDRVATEAATLTLPENEAFALQLKGQLGDAAASLVKQLKAGKWRPELPEQDVAELGGTFVGQKMSGNIDLIIKGADGRRGVVDLKLGGSFYQGDSLRRGTALQLAVYSKAAATGAGPLPPVAYFILEDGELITTDAAAFPDATHQSGPAPDQTFLDAERAWNWWAGTLRAGHVVGRGSHIADDIDHDALERVAGGPPPDHPWADKPANCRFCNARRLCTFTLGGGAS
jgi:hypothetical protein